MNNIREMIIKIILEKDAEIDDGVQPIDYDTAAFVVDNLRDFDDDELASMFGPKVVETLRKLESYV